MYSKKKWAIIGILSVLNFGTLIFSDISLEPQNTKINKGYSFAIICRNEIVQQPIENLGSDFFNLKSNRWKYTLIVTERECLSLKVKPLLTVIADNDSNRTYVCKPSTTGFHKIGAEGELYIQDPLTFINRHTQFGTFEAFEDAVKLKCVTFSIPPPTRVSWTFNDVAIDSSNQNYLISEDLFSNGIESTLTIRKTKCKHGGAYRCTVKNSDTDSGIKMVLNTWEYYLLLLLGLIALILIVRLILVIRRRSKNKIPVAVPIEKKDIEETCKEPDRPSEFPDAAFLSKDVHSRNYSFSAGSVANNQRDLKSYFLPTEMYLKYSVTWDKLSESSISHFGSLRHMQKANKEQCNDFRSLRRSNTFRV